MVCKRIEKPDLEKILSKEFIEEQAKKLQEAGVALQKTPNGVLIYVKGKTYLPATLPTALAPSKEKWRPFGQLRSSQGYSEIISYEVTEKDLVIYFKQKKPSYSEPYWYKAVFSLDEIKRSPTGLFTLDLDSI